MQKCKIRRTGNKYEIVFYNSKPPQNETTQDTPPLPLREPKQLTLEQWQEDTRNYELEAQHRAKRKVIDYGLNNEWTHFVTVTYDRKKIDRNNAEVVRLSTMKALNNYRNRYDKDFAYLLIPEPHKDGAVHFHGFIILGDTNQDQLTQRYCHKTHKHYYISEYLFKRFGANRLESINSLEYSSYYISKYTTKDNSRVFNRYYFASKGLTTAQDIAELEETQDITEVRKVLCGWNKTGEVFESVARTEWATIYSLDTTQYDMLLADIIQK